MIHFVPGVTREMAALAMGLGAPELVIIFFVALSTLAIPILVIWLVFSAGKRRGIAEATRVHEPPD